MWTTIDHVIGFGGVFDFKDLFVFQGTRTIGPQPDMVYLVWVLARRKKCLPRKWLSLLVHARPIITRTRREVVASSIDMEIYATRPFLPLDFPLPFPMAR